MLTRDSMLFTSYWVYRGAEPPTNSDHCLVIGSARVEVFRRPKLPQSKKLDAESLFQDASITARYNIAVRISSMPSACCVTTESPPGAQSEMAYYSQP